MDNLELIKKVGFDFSWSEKKVWSLNEPVITMPILELVWHFDIPFWNKGAGIYNLSPNQVMENPRLHKEEWERIQKADTSHPLDIMENKGRWLLLDGLHRLSKLFLKKENSVQVRIIPRTRIPEIMNLDKTISECKRKLSAEGFPYVYEWKDKPNFQYKEHFHKDRVSFFILDGSIFFTYVNGETRKIIAGDRIDVVQRQLHSAKIGPHGVLYIVGRMTEGNS